jgi:hypothetical protein
MLSGNILDVYPDNKRNVMVTWLTNNGKSIKVEDKYNPTFYVYSKRDKLVNLATLLRDLPQVEKLIEFYF